MGSGNVRGETGNGSAVKSAGLVINLCKSIAR